MRATCSWRSQCFGSCSLGAARGLPQARGPDPERQYDVVQMTIAAHASVENCAGIRVTPEYTSMAWIEDGGTNSIAASASVCAWNPSGTSDALLLRVTRTPSM